MSRLLEVCAYHRVNGTLTISSWARSGALELRDGEVVDVVFHQHRGEAAFDELRLLRDAMFVLVSSEPVTLDAPVASRVRGPNISTELPAEPAPAPTPVLAEPVHVVPSTIPTAAAWNAQAPWGAPAWDVAHGGQRPLTAPPEILGRGVPRISPVIGIALLCLTLLVGMMATQL